MLDKNAESVGRGGTACIRSRQYSNKAIYAVKILRIYFSVYKKNWICAVIS